MERLASRVRRVFPKSEKNKGIDNEVKAETDQSKYPPGPAGTPPKTQVAPAESTELASSEVECVDLWTPAFKEFQDRNAGQKLVADYTKYLGSLGDDANSSVDLSSPRSVEAVVKKLLAKRESSRWRFTFRDREITIRSQAVKFVKFINYCEPIVKEAASAEPYAALACAGISLVIPLLLSGVTEDAEMLEGFAWIIDLQMFWQFWERKKLAPKYYELLKEPLIKLYSYIIEYQARVIVHLTSPQHSRLWHDLCGSNAWTETKKKIDQLNQNCRSRVTQEQDDEIRENTAAQLSEIKQLRVVGEDTLRSKKEHWEDEKERDLLRDLVAVAGEYQYTMDRNPKRVPGTCEWFLKDKRFVKWRKSDSDLLWVSAGPGRGKSVLSRSLVTEGHLIPPTTTITLTPSGVEPDGKPVVAYFFFKEGGGGKMDGAQALCAILHQIFQDPRTSHLIKYALPEHRAYNKHLTDKLPVLWQILVNCVTDSDASDTVCVLDALDECEQESREWIQNNLVSFYQNAEESSKSKLKVLFTSRPDQVLEQSFKKLQGNTAYMRLDGDEKSEQIREEIDLVIDAEVANFTEGFNHKDVQRIKSRLKSMENRTYLWLHLILDIIKKDMARYSKRSRVEDLLSQLPTQVSDVYENLLNRSTHVRQTKILLEILLAAERPLTLAEANIALTLALRERPMKTHAAIMKERWSCTKFHEVVRDFCGHFISIHDKKLSFIHQTAREFLTTKREGSGGCWEGSFTLQRSHSTMWRACLDYLLLPDIGGPEDEKGFLNMGSFHLSPYPFLEYSGSNWHTHFAKQDCARSDKAAMDGVRELCHPRRRPVQVWYRARPGELSPLALSGWTSLGFACCVGLKKFAQILLKEGARINDGRDTPLQIACRFDHEDVVDMLLRNKANPSGMGSSFGTPLFCAIMNHNERIIKMLLERGADVDELSETYNPALIQASIFDLNRVVESLVNYNADVNIQANGTALDAAARRGNLQTVEVLLTHGADVNIQDPDGDTPLYAAAVRGYQKIVEILLSYGADINIQDPDGDTPLYAAAGGGYQKIVEILLTHGADANIPNLHNDTPLHAAAVGGHQEIVEILLSYNADVNMQNSYGETPLHTAAAGGHQEIVEILLSHNADVNIQGGPYKTALQAAAAEGHEEIVQILLSHKADINIQGGVFKTALQAAAREGHQNIVDLLLSHGAKGRIQNHGD